MTATVMEAINTCPAYLDWIETETGAELSAFFEGWLMGAETPPRR